MPWGVAMSVPSAYKVVCCMVIIPAAVICRGAMPWCVACRGCGVPWRTSRLCYAMAYKLPSYAPAAMIVPWRAVARIRQRIHQYQRHYAWRKVVSKIGVLHDVCMAYTPYAYRERARDNAMVTMCEVVLKSSVMFRCYRMVGCGGLPGIDDDRIAGPPHARRPPPRPRTPLRAARALFALYRAHGWRRG
jgi:hypothetical protein